MKKSIFNSVCATLIALSTFSAFSGCKSYIQEAETSENVSNDDELVALVKSVQEPNPEDEYEIMLQAILEDDSSYPIKMDEASYLVGADIDEDDVNYYVAVDEDYVNMSDISNNTSLIKDELINNLKHPKSVSELPYEVKRLIRENNLNIGNAQKLLLFLIDKTNRGLCYIYFGSETKQSCFICISHREIHNILVNYY